MSGRVFKPLNAQEAFFNCFKKRQPIGRGDKHALFAIEQAEFQFFFQVGNQTADSGLADVHDRCRRHHRAAVHHMIEGFKLSEFHRSLYNIFACIIR